MDRSGSVPARVRAFGVDGDPRRTPTRDIVRPLGATPCATPRSSPPWDRLPDPTPRWTRCLRPGWTCSGSTPRTARATTGDAWWSGCGAAPRGRAASSGCWRISPARRSASARWPIRKVCSSRRAPVCGSWSGTSRVTPSVWPLPANRSRPRCRAARRCCSTTGGSCCGQSPATAPRSSPRWSMAGCSCPARASTHPASNCRSRPSPTSTWRKSRRPWRWASTSSGSASCRARTTCARPAR